MKPFLGIDLTNNKKNEQFNDEAYLVMTPSGALAQSFEHQTENAQQQIEKSKLPLGIRIGHWICGTVGALVVIGILKAMTGEDSVSLAQAYENADWLFWIGGACLVIWGILKLISMRREKEVLESDESERIFDNFDKTCEAIFTELAVPQDARDVDVLSFYYKLKGDEIKLCEKGLQIAPYNNPVFRIFSDAEHLYLANLEGKHAIPFSALKAIRSSKKTIRILTWNKDEMYDKGIYKQYKLDHDNFGCIICKGYHILEFEYQGEVWGIYFPNYELPVFEELTGLKAEEF